MHQKKASTTLYPNGGGIYFVEYNSEICHCQGQPIARFSFFVGFW